jgi:hypothetical protein
LTVEFDQLDRIWDRGPGRPAASAALKLPGGFAGWVKAPLNARAAPGRPYRCAVRGPATVAWAQASEYPAGTCAQALHRSEGGCEAKNRHLPSFQPGEIDLPAYQHWFTRRSVALAARIHPAPMPYGAGNVNNGVAWPIDMPNLWISDPAEALPQFVDLDFGSAEKIGTVLISFDTDLDRQADQMAPFWTAATCARHWRLHARSGGGWKQVFEERDNYLRRRTAKFEPLQTTGIRLEILSIRGDPSARVYEIRVYGTRPG